MITLIIAFAYIGWLQTSVQVAKMATKPFLAPPPEYIEHFHFGFNDSMADSFWLRWIQDSENCTVYARELKTQTYDITRRGDSFYNPRYKVCDGSWAFKMLDAVTKLAPRFKMPYLAGGISLAVLTEDYQGATIIFDRGLKVYPEDWLLLYRAAFHYLYDLDDLVRAAELLERAADHGAPPWTKSLASKLYSKSGRLELGISTLESYRRGLTDEKLIVEVDRRLALLKRQLSLSKQEFNKEP